MDIYLSSLLLGGVGLGAMALGGVGRHGHGDSGHGHGHVGDSGHGHGDAGGAHGHAHLGDSQGHAHVGHGHTQAHAHDGSHAHTQDHGQTVQAHQPAALWLLSWPRLMFGFLLGTGATGLALQPLLMEPLTGIAAVTGGVAFQGLIIRPLWNFFFRFASAPALTSESADEATAVTAFNANGEGLVALEVDGQVVQVLGQLNAADRSLGVVVRAGQKLRVEDVNTANNRCTVSTL